MPKPGHAVVQLRITLEELRPPIWRRLLIPGEAGLPRLHAMFHAAMGWTGSHLHQFRVDGAVYGGDLDEDPDEDELDESDYTVDEVIRGVRRFFYDYDFGDDWHHEVVIENSVSTARGLKHAVCLDGQRACPPEDIGGPPGYEELVAACDDPASESYQRYLAWLGRPFDPEAFSLADVNSALQQIR